MKLNCPRCNNRSYTKISKDEIKCLACSYADFKVPSDVLKEVQEGLGKKGSATTYVKKYSKKYH